jgi:MraZ protein
MPLFLSTYINKLDKKGRVSVPAPFRAALANEGYQGIVAFRSSHYSALEAFSWSFMEEIGRRLDHFDLFSDNQDDLATAIFGDSVQLPFDGDGRIILPQELLTHAELDGSVCFVGLGPKFQIWNPKTFKARRDTARKNVKAQSLSLPNQKKGDT